MAWEEGNQFWRLADHKGQNIAFESPQDLWDKASDYFKWCDDNPLQEMKVFNGKEGIVSTNVPKMRAYTLKHLCLHIGVNEKYFNQFNEEGNPEYSNIITRIRDIIYTQKFQGAAADLLNPNIIARELGLADKQDHTGNHTVVWEEVKTYEANDKAD